MGERVDEYDFLNQRRVLLRDALGKRLDNVLYGFQCLMLVWEDRTFSLIGVSGGHYAEIEPEIAEFAYSSNVDVPHADVIDAGVATREEFDAIEQARQLAWAAYKEASERAEYERLHRKYGELETEAGNA